MSNNDWNNGQADGQRQPTRPEDQQGQAGAGDGATSADPSTSPEGNQQQQPQSYGQGPDGSTGAHPQSSANDWTHSPQPPQGTNPRGWNQPPQGQQPQQSWNQNAPGGPAPGQQWQQPPAKTPNAFARVFDFSFRKFALPDASGAIFLIVVIAAALWWLVDAIYAASVGGGEFGIGGGFIVQILLGGLARTVILIVLARVFIEGMTTLVRNSRRDEDS